MGFAIHWLYLCLQDDLLTLTRFIVWIKTRIPSNSFDLRSFWSSLKCILCASNPVWENVFWASYFPPEFICRKRRISEILVIFCHKHFLYNRKFRKIFQPIKFPSINSRKRILVFDRFIQDFNKTGMGGWLITRQFNR